MLRRTRLLAEAFHGALLDGGARLVATEVNSMAVGVASGGISIEDTRSGEDGVAAVRIPVEHLARDEGRAAAVGIGVDACHVAST